jgi:hypothetical protein
VAQKLGRQYCDEDYASIDAERFVVGRREQASVDLVTDMPDAAKRRRADFVLDSSQGFDHTRGADSRHFANYRDNATPVTFVRAASQSKRRASNF